MSGLMGSGADLIDLMRKRAPESLDLVTAETDEEFESAFCTLMEQAVVGLEANSKHFVSLDEEGLSAVLTCSLRMPGVSVSQETHSNGHVDITIQMDHCTPVRRKLAEAKMYKGPAYHVSGLGQLLNRYTTGREGRGMVIVYCRDTDIMGKVKGLRTHMDKNLPHDQQGGTSDHILKWSFRSDHAHTSGEIVGVDHIGCNLYTG